MPRASCLRMSLMVRVMRHEACHGCCSACHCGARTYRDLLMPIIHDLHVKGRPPHLAARPKLPHAPERGRAFMFFVSFFMFYCILVERRPGNTSHQCRTQWFSDYTRPSSSPGPLTLAEAPRSLPYSTSKSINGRKTAESFRRAISTGSDVHAFVDCIPHGGPMEACAA